MTSKLTREENVQAVFDLKAGYTLGLADVEILKRVARMALAAMGDDPHTDDELSNLLWYSQEATCHSDPNYYCEFQRLATPGFIASIIRELQDRRKADSEPVATLDVQSRRPDGNKFALVFSSAAHKLPDDVYFLYRHAQPAPVVPDKMNYQGGVLFVLNNDMSSIERGTVAMRAWNACRAAMLQGAENTESRCGIQTAPALDSFKKNADARCGNSPVIPEGYVMVPKEPTAEMISSGIAAHYERSQIQIHDRPAPGPIECAYVAMLAAAPQEVPHESK